MRLIIEENTNGHINIKKVEENKIEELVYEGKIFVPEKDVYNAYILGAILSGIIATVIIVTYFAFVV